MSIDLAFLGAGVLFIIANDDLAQYAKERKGLTRREALLARIVWVLLGLGFVAFGGTDLVLAALGRPAFHM